MQTQNRRTRITLADVRADMLTDLMNEWVPSPVARRLFFGCLTPAVLLWVCLPYFMRDMFRIALMNPKSNQAKDLKKVGALMHLTLIFATPDLDEPERQRMYARAKASAKDKRRLLAQIEAHEATFVKAGDTAGVEAEDAGEMDDGTGCVSLAQLMLMGLASTEEGQGYFGAAHELLQALSKALGGDPESLSDDALLLKVNAAVPAPGEGSTVEAERQVVDTLYADVVPIVGGFIGVPFQH